MINIQILDTAENLVKQGLSLKKTAKELNIPYTSLNYALRERNVKSNHKTFSRINTLNENFFEIIDSEEKAYWLGYLAADGSITTQKANKRINLSIKESDYNHLIKYKESLNLSNLPKKKRIFLHTTNKEYWAYRYIITSKIMFNDLLNKGITERKSLTLKPPINVPDELIRHWIRGYFDGDGSIYFCSLSEKYHISIRGTKEILRFIKDFIYSIGELPEKAVFQDTRKNIYCYRLRINSSDNKIKFYEKIYKDANIFLERKKLLFDIFKLEYLER